MWVRSQDRKLLINANIFFVTKEIDRYYLKCGVGNSEYDEFEVIGAYENERDALRELNIICHNQNIYWVGATTEFTR